MKYLPILFLLLFSCQTAEDVYVPKPRGYSRITLPEHEYVALDGKYPYQFKVSKHAQVMPDPHYLAQEHWIEVKYPQWGAEIDISYKGILNRPDSLAGFIATSHKLTRKHSVKATKIEEYNSRGGLNKEFPAVIFELEGEVPSYFHWYAHDSTQHFVRAALYFNSADNSDSLRPIIDYLKYDMVQMLNTLEFKK